MSMFFVYSIKSALCLAAFYLLYMLLFRRATFHAFNRAVLLGFMALSFLLPLVHVPAESLPVAVGGMAYVEGFVVAPSVADVAPSYGLTPVRMLFVIYIIGVVFFAVRELRSFLSLRLMMRRGSTEELDDGVRLTIIKGNISPFSWFGNVVMGENDYKECPDKILLHEKAHIAGHHSIDLLLCDVLTIAQWFNPAAWLFKSEMQDVHEYEADEAVLRSGVDAREYQLLLIRKAVGDSLYSMTNNLNDSSLKKRIEMMKTKKNNPWSRARLLAVLPVAAIAVAVFADPTVKSVENQVNDESKRVLNTVSAELRNAPAEPRKATSEAAGVKKAEAKTTPVAHETASDDNDNNTYTIVEEQPQFPGGNAALAKFLNENVKYPASAVEAKQQGRVILTFTVSKDGSISDVKVIRCVSPDLDAEALRVVGSMPKWTPGKVKGEPVNVRYVIPITFSLPK